MYVGVAFLVSSTILLIGVFINRVRIISKNSLEKKYLKTWRKILLTSIDSIPDNLKKIPHNYKEISLIMWNDFIGLLKGHEKEQLIRLANSLDLNSYALETIDSKREDKKLLAIQSLGNLENKEYFSKLESAYFKNRSTTIKLEAIHSMAKIEPEKSVSKLIDFFKNRDYYPNYKIAVILQELGPDKFSTELANLILSSSIEKQQKLMNFFVFGKSKEALKLAMYYLDNSKDPELIAGSIKLIENFGDSRYLKVVKRFLDHEQAFVRINAVRTIGVLGSTNEIPELEKKLADFSWWVRLRAAEALKSLPGMTLFNLGEIRKRQSDKYAKEILDYVLLSERK
jgi:hypothetical protein